MRSTLYRSILIKEGIDMYDARIWAWRIENEYPKDLAQVMIHYYQTGELLDVNYYGTTLQRTMRVTEFGILESSYLMYILSKDVGEAAVLYDLFAKKDIPR